MAPTIVIAAGGTAGHVVPALAVADALRAEGARVVFVGGERAERTMVPEAGYELRPIAVEGLSRSNPLKAARAVAAGRAAPSARRGGSCATCAPTRCSAAAATSPGPVALAAVARRVPLVLAEADSHLGLTNRLLARWARRVCLAFPIAGRDGRALPGHRAPGAAAGDRSRRRPRALRPGRGRHAACSSSAARWARARSTRRRCRRWPAPTSACCTRAARATTTRCARGSAPIRRPTTTCASSSRPFGEALLASDLCVARAGGSIFEIAAHGRPAILVPYPYASADHQTSNARWMAAGRRRGRRRRRAADARAAGERGRRAARPIARGWRRWGARRRRWRGREAAQRIAEEVLAAAR